jgi:hypothetical protein
MAALMTALTDFPALPVFPVSPVVALLPQPASTSPIRMMLFRIVAFIADSFSMLFASTLYSGA